MSTINPSETASGSIPELREWAATLLGIDVAADPRQQRRQALAKLEESDYRPPRAWREAIDALVSPPQEFRSSDWPEFQRDVEDRLTEAVESFAATFLDLPPAEREEGGQTLNARCADFPILRRRLAPLFPAVDVDRENRGLPEGRAQELAQLALRLVPLPRPERNRTRIAAIEAMHSDPVSWEEAAKSIGTTFPKIAALAPELFDEVSKFSTFRQTAISTRNVRRTRRQGVRTRDLEQSSSESFLGKHWWILIVVLVALRGCASLYKAVGNDPQPSVPVHRPVNSPSVPAVPDTETLEEEEPKRAPALQALADEIARRRKALIEKKNSGSQLNRDEEEFLRKFPPRRRRKSAPESEAPPPKADDSTVDGGSAGKESDPP